MLFRNRQPRFMICICVQDLTGVSPQLRRNLDSLWLFGGNVSRQNFMFLLNQCYPDVKDKKEFIWDNYRNYLLMRSCFSPMIVMVPKSKFSNVVFVPKTFFTLSNFVNFVNFVNSLDYL
jgi:hypothetical protein